MKKLYLLLPILFLIYWSCEDQTNDNNDETSVSTASVTDDKAGVLKLKDRYGQIQWYEIGNAK